MLHLQELTKLFKEKGEALPKEIEFQEHEKRDYVKSNEQGFTTGLFKHFGLEKKNLLVSDVDEDLDVIGSTLVSQRMHHVRCRSRLLIRLSFTIFLPSAHWVKDELKYGYYEVCALYNFPCVSLLPHGPSRNLTYGPL